MNMKYIEELEKAINAFKADRCPDNLSLENLKDSINKVFDGGHTECISVLYTQNTDNLFFGVIVYPVIDDLVEVLIGDDKKYFNKYFLELDSKLFELGLSTREIAAYILHDIYHIAEDPNIVQSLRGYIDSYFLQNDTKLSIRDSAQYQAIIAYGAKDTLYKITSLLYRDESVVGDGVIMGIGYGDELESAYKKITKTYDGMITTVNKPPKLMVMDWCFRLYADVAHKRIPAMHLLEKIKSVTGSILIKREVDRVIRALNRIDTDIVQEASIVLESFKKKSSFLNQIKYNGLRGIEDDYYEFMVRARNAETEEDVMYALRQINLRMSILDDYISKEEMDDTDRQRWVDLYMKYKDIRDLIAKKKTYNRKNYGLFFDYNKLDELE